MAHATRTSHQESICVLLQLPLPLPLSLFECLAKVVDGGDEWREPVLLTQEVGWDGEGNARGRAQAKLCHQMASVANLRSGIPLGHQQRLLQHAARQQLAIGRECNALHVVLGSRLPRGGAGRGEGDGDSRRGAVAAEFPSSG